MLEKLVGQRLVDRPGGPRPAELTEAGRMLLTHADAIVARLRAARADLSALAAGEAGALRVGAFQSAGARLLPQLLRRFSEAWPRVEVSLTEAEDDVLVAALEAGDLDLAFLVLPIASAPIETTELLRDPYVLVTQTGSPLARRRTPPGFREIGRLPLVGLPVVHRGAAGRGPDARGRRRADVRLPLRRQRDDPGDGRGRHGRCAHPAPDGERGLTRA